MNDAEVRAGLASEAAKIEEDSLYTYKGQFNASDMWRRRHYWLGIPATAAATLTGMSAAAQWDAAITAALSVATGLLTGLLTFLNPQKNAQAAYAAAAAFKGLNIRARQFRELDLPQLSTADARAALARLSESQLSLLESSPPIPRRAFEKARKGIEGGEATYAQQPLESARP